MNTEAKVVRILDINHLIGVPVLNTLCYHEVYLYARHVLPIKNTALCSVMQYYDILSNTRRFDSLEITRNL